MVKSRRPGGVHDTEVTVFDSVGFALDRLHEQRWGTRTGIDLIADLEDPKEPLCVLASRTEERGGSPRVTGELNK